MFWNSGNKRKLEELQQKIDLLENNLAEEQHKSVSLQSTIEVEKQKIDLLGNNLSEEQRKNVSLQSTIEVEKIKCTLLESDLEAHKDEIHRQKQIVSSLEMRRELHGMFDIARDIFRGY